MTTFDRFDPFERRIGEALDGLAPARRPDYLDDLLQLTARTAQRPRWSFPGRWLPVDSTLSRPLLFGRIPIRQVLIVGVVAALLAAMLAAYIGSQRRLPSPYGPATNGRLVFGMNGDLYAADTIDGTPRLLLGGPSAQQGVVLSPDGQLVAYDDYTGTAGPEAGANPHEWVVNLDGSNPREVLTVPFTFDSFEWAADSRSIAIVTDMPSQPHLFIAQADGSGARDLQFGAFLPYAATFDPTRADVLLVQAVDRTSLVTDLTYVTTEGKVLSSLGLKPLNLNGPPFELSGAAFSSDGQTIAYNAIVAREQPVNRFRVHLVSRDGSNDREIAAPFDSNYSQAWPAFSPDGKWVLMDTWKTRADGNLDHQLAIAPTDGSAPARLIGPILDDANQIKMWSPDGTRILQCACEHHQLYSVDPSTGAYDLLPWQSDLPGWQRLAR